MNEMSKCPLCGGPLQPTYVCQSCGAEIKMDPDKTVKKLEICPLCGGKLVLRYFCSNCGTEINEDAEAELICPVCGAAIEDSMDTCPECGTPLAFEEVEEVVYECPLCGSEIPLGADVCPNCGARFEESETEAINEPAIEDKGQERKQRRLKGGYSEEELRNIMKIPGVGRVKAETLCKNGYNTLHKIKNASVKELASIPHIGKKNARNIKKAINNTDISQLEKSELIEDVIEEEFECPVCGTIVSAFDTSCYECGVSFEDETIEEETAKEMDREKAALSFYDMKLMDTPQNPELWFGRGSVLSRMGDYPGALESFEKCIELDPENRKYWMVRAQMLTNLGRYREAAVSYNRAAGLANNREPHSEVADLSDLSEHELMEFLLEEGLHRGKQEKERESAPRKEMKKSVKKIAEKKSHHGREERIAGGKAPKPKSSRTKRDLKDISGRTNGLTNGLSAGAEGKKRGLAKKKKSEGENETHEGRMVGLTNGSGRLGHGRINGITNGSGFIHTAGITTVGGFWTRKKYSTVTILVFLMLMFSIYAVTIAPQIQSGKMGNIDGTFSEWGTVYHYSIRDINTGNPDIDVISAASYLSQNYIYFMFQVKGLIAPSNTVCTYLIFLDTDNNASTGYDLDGFGADYMLDIYGQDGSVSGTLKAFSNGTGRNWVDWEDFTTVRVARGTGAEACMMETGIPLYSGLISGDITENSVNAVVATLDSAGHRAMSSLVFGPDGLPSVSIAPINTVGENAIISGSNAEIATLNIKGDSLEGSSTNIRIGGSISHGSLNAATLTLGDSGATSVTITADVSGVSPGTAVYYTLSRSDITATSGGKNVHIGLVNLHASAYVSKIPDNIVIDGAFADWSNITKNQDESETGIPAGVDITGYAGVMEGDTFYFFSETRGDTLSGSPIPFERLTLHSTGGATHNMPEAPEDIYGEDILRVYLDTDSDADTGRGIAGIGADIMIEFRGQYGNVVSSRVFSFRENGWHLSVGKIAGLPCGTDFEGSLDLSSIPHSGNISFVIYTTDWNHHEDWSSPVYAGQITEGLRSGPADPVPLPEFSDIIPVLFATIAVLYFHRRRR